MTKFDITSHKCLVQIVLNKFAIQNYRSKVKDTVSILRKKLCHGSSAFLWTDLDIISHNYDNIWDNCAFEHCRSKDNVTDAILGKTLSGF